MLLPEKGMVSRGGNKHWETINVIPTPNIFRKTANFEDTDTSGWTVVNGAIGGAHGSNPDPMLRLTTVGGGKGNAMFRSAATGGPTGQGYLVMADAPLVQGAINHTIVFRTRIRAASWPAIAAFTDFYFGFNGGTTPWPASNAAITLTNFVGIRVGNVNSATPNVDLLANGAVQAIAVGQTIVGLDWILELSIGYDASLPLANRYSVNARVASTADNITWTSMGTDPTNLYTGSLTFGATAIRLVEGLGFFTTAGTIMDVDFMDLIIVSDRWPW